MISKVRTCPNCGADLPHYINCVELDTNGLYTTKCNDCGCEWKEHWTENFIGVSNIRFKRGNKTLVLKDFFPAMNETDLHYAELALPMWQKVKVRTRMGRLYFFDEYPEYYWGVFGQCTEWFNRDGTIVSDELRKTLPEPILDNVDCVGIYDICRKKLIYDDGVEGEYIYHAGCVTTKNGTIIKDERCDLIIKGGNDS